MTVISPPGGEYFRALSSRMDTSCPRLFSSPTRVRVGWMRREKVFPWLLATAWKDWAVSATRSEKGRGRKAVCRWGSSIRER